MMQLGEWIASDASGNYVYREYSWAADMKFCTSYHHWDYVHKNDFNEKFKVLWSVEEIEKPFCNKCMAKWKK